MLTWAVAPGPINAQEKPKVEAKDQKNPDAKDQKKPDRQTPGQG